MKKILGLDLGTTSIGWAFVTEKERNGGEIKKLGVRIIPLTKDEKDEFAKGNQISTNANRTLKRGARRNNQRFKQRRDFLLKRLIQINFISDYKEVKSTNAFELYKARANAISEKISKIDFAKILILINGKRGYQSNRKANKEENETDYLNKIITRDRELVTRKITIGQKLFELIKDNPLASLKNNIYSRASYIEEFDKIWAEQSKYYPELTDKLKHEFKNKIIFYQRDLKSQKSLLSECIFEKHHKVIPASSPLFQEIRIWQRLHDIRIKDRKYQEEELSQEEKEFLFDILQEKEKLTDKQILKSLKLSTKEYSLNFKKIDGNTTRAKLIDIFTKTGYDIDEILDLDICLSGNDFDKQPFMQLWHLIYSAKSDKKLIVKLKETFLFNEEQAVAISKITYPLKYGSLSSRAIRKILPFMKEGHEYSIACQLVGYRHSIWITKEENEKRVLKDKLELVKKNSLRNPVVEKILNQLVNLVNAIIDDERLGKPDEIRIEMARELKMPAKKRKILSKNISDRTKQHEKIRKILIEEYGLRSVSRNDIIKYKLANEVNWVSVYSGKPIDHKLLFTSNYYDIEHIIPKSRLFDDSYSNKTICESNLNRDKGNMTAYDYMLTRGEEKLNQYLARVDDLFKAKKIPRNKHQKLLMQQKNIPTDFINRQLNETQFIARETTRILRQICRHVKVTSGSITALLRNSWELPFVIQELNVEKYRKINQTKLRDIKTNGNGKKRVELIFLKEKGKEIPWSKRNDHRHHAVDALVVAFTKQSYIQKLNTLNEQFDDRIALKEAAWKFPPPWLKFREDSKKALDEILVSFKEKNKVTTRNVNKIKNRKKGKDVVQIVATPRGPLHKETVYGKICRYASRKTPLKKINQENIQLVCNEEIKILLLDTLQRNEGDYKRAFNPKNNPIFYKGKQLLNVQCFEEYYTVRKIISPDLNIDKVTDAAIKKILNERLKIFNNEKKQAFSGLDENPIYLNKEKGITIKRVRVLEKASNVVALHHNKNKPIDYVFTGGNHHIAVFLEKGGKIIGESVSFFEAVTRKLANLPIINKEHKTNAEYLFNIQKGDYFVFYEGEVTPEMDFLDKKNFALISKNLFRVQKISMPKRSPNIMFRHHLETTVTGEAPFAFKHIQSFQNIVGYCQKVQINLLGDIVKIGEY